MVTQKRLKEVLYYNKVVGVFEWRKRGTRMNPGQMAGVSIKDRGYIMIGIDGKRYPAHHLVWLYMTGVWPENQIDHKDGDKTNNLFENLREVKPYQNSWNSAITKRNTSGVKGITYDKAAKQWRAVITVNGKKAFNKNFRTKEEAEIAIKVEREKLHGEYANHGVHKYIQEELDSA